jgi:cell division protein FtsA
VQAAAVTTKEVSEQQQKEQGLLSWFKRFIKDGNEIDDASFLDKK